MPGTHAAAAPCKSLAGMGVEWRSQPGPAECLQREFAAQHEGQRFRRIDIGISGKAEGAVVADGARSAYFTTAPEFVFAQTGYTEWLPATVQYEAAKGMGVTLIFPAEPARWNAKLFVTAHGAGRSAAAGNLKPWNTRIRAGHALEDLTRYELLMLEKGYALAKTHRSTDKNRGDCALTLADGATREDANITEVPHILLDFATVAKGILRQQLGRTPQRTYFYGHSAGGRNGRLINYILGLNREKQSTHAIDGFLIDDAGSGLWLPVLLEKQNDVLLGSTFDRQQFVPQIDITHLLYIAFKDEPSPDWVSSSYLINKRENATILARKNLSEKHRYYEVRGVSHSGGESGTVREDSDVRTIPLWRLFDALIDRLDEWVDQSQPAPANRADDVRLASLPQGDGRLRPALALPEVACPLGVYHQYPASLGEKGIGQTGFAPFDAALEEPLDGRGVFVDMNQNGYHDRRESIEQAWRRLGLLAASEPFTRDAYTTCVEHAARSLKENGFLTQASVDDYSKQAATIALPGIPGANRNPGQQP